MPDDLISFEAKLRTPRDLKGTDPWLFLRLPQPASDRLPSRSMVSVEGTFQGQEFFTTLEPDGEGGHWMRVEDGLIVRAQVAEGFDVQVAIRPMDKEPEPKVPPDVQSAFDSAEPKARETWAAITPLARRDWIFWITSAKKQETRVKRICVALSKLSAGSRRPCCFDRSGMYDKSLSCPESIEEK